MIIIAMIIINKKDDDDDDDDDDINIYYYSFNIFRRFCLVKTPVNCSYNQQVLTATAFKRCEQYNIDSMVYLIGS